MGLFDQNKQWDFGVNAPPEACNQAFRNAFVNGGGLLRGANWESGSASDSASGEHLVSVFMGRSGLGGFLNSMSGRGREQSEAAIGSAIAFAAEPGPNGGSQCSMWLKAATTTMGFKNEASLLRSYMRSVEAELRKLDPQLVLHKN